MANIESAFIDLGYLDTLATRDSAIHRLDPRVKSTDNGAVCDLHSFLR